MIAFLKQLTITVFELIFKRNTVRYEIYIENNDYYLKKYSVSIRSSKSEKNSIPKFLSHKKFTSMNELWKYITHTEKWYVAYGANQFINVENYIEELAPFIHKTTNVLRQKMEFSEDDIPLISRWDHLIIRNEEKSEFMLAQRKQLKTFCANCKKANNGFRQRYPKSICHDCRSKVTDAHGRNVEFFNSEGLGYGCQGYYSGTNQQEKYNSNSCFIQGKEFIAKEAKFGGIVINLK